MLRFQILNLFFMAGLFFNSSLEAQSLEPGIWHAKTDFTVDGISLPASIGEECVSTEQAKDAKGTISKALDKIGCILTQWNVKDNYLEAALECKNSELNAKGIIRGQFSEKNYQLEGSAHGFYLKVIPAVATLKLNGQWLNICSLP